MTDEEVNHIKEIIQLTVIWSNECEGMNVGDARTLITHLETRIIYVVNNMIEKRTTNGA